MAFNIRQFLKVPKNVPKKNVIIALIIILVGTASFAMGKLSSLLYGREPVKIEYGDTLKAEVITAGQVAAPIRAGGGVSATTSITKPTPSKSVTGSESVVASKNGTKYYLPSCSGANRILEVNKVWFGSPEEAQKAGYEPSATCKGLR